MRKLPAGLVLAVASAALAQPVAGPASSAAGEAGRLPAAAEPMSRQALLACMELEDGIHSRSSAIDARARALDDEKSAIASDAKGIEADRKALDFRDKAAAEALSRRTEALDRRVAAGRADADRLDADARRLRDDADRYNATCAARPYLARDKELALAEYRRRKAAAAEPFEAGVKAFDEGRYQDALAAWLPLAEQGRAAAQFNLAVMYEKGLGVAGNAAEAARWYLAAAQRGDVSSQLKVGDMYAAGVGVARDLANASYWYGEAANGKDAAAARLARERLARLPEAFRAGAEDVIAFDGGRYLLRRAANKDCVVALQGTVTPAANLGFAEVLDKAAAQGCARPLTLLLESPGGIHEAGLALGRSVRAESMRTVARYDCASACASIFLGGTERVLWGARAAIGLHQLAHLAASGNVADGACLPSRDDPGVVAMRRYLRFAVPESADEIFDIVMSTPCKSITWVKGRRALELHVATRVEAETEDVFGPREERVNASATVPR